MLLVSLLAGTKLICQPVMPASLILIMIAWSLFDRA